MKIIRRILSIIFYILGGIFLMSWAMMAYVGGEPDAPKAWVMGILGAFALVPLAIGGLVSPGRRGREIGIVLLVAAGWTIFTAVTLVVLMMDPEFVAMMPPESQQSLGMFNDYWFGAAFTIVMGGAGVWLVWRKDKHSQPETLPARIRRIFG